MQLLFLLPYKCAFYNFIELLLLCVAYAYICKELKLLFNNFSNPVQLLIEELCIKNNMHNLFPTGNKKVIPRFIK